MEGLFEKELKGQNGCAISIVDSNGNKKKIVVSTIVENGKDIKLTIDSDLQKELYEQYKDDKSCTVAMNQYTGEVLALSSTPSYDNNDLLWECQMKNGLHLMKMKENLCITVFDRSGVRALRLSLS